MSDWYMETEKRIDNLKSAMKPKDVKGLQLDYLKIIIKRLDKESLTCEKCDYLKKDLSESINILEDKKVITQVQRKAYNGRMRLVITHFRKEHGIVTSNYYAGLYSHYGLIVGIALGISFFDKALIMLMIMFLSPFIGKLIGGYIDSKNDKLI